MDLKKQFLCLECSNKLKILAKVDPEEHCSWDEEYHLFSFSGPARKAIHQFKYQKKQFLIRGFSSYFEEIIFPFLRDSDIDFITFVPMNYFSYFFRSYNHSFVIAKAISRILNKPIKKVLKKKFLWKNQALKDKEQRQLGLSNILKLRKKFQNVDNNELEDKNVFLVDDVMTTGSTLNLCTELLKRKGVARVIIFTVAR